MKFFVRILMLVTLTLTLLASAPDDRLGRSAKCRSMASSAGQCQSMPYTIYYTDATKTVECGWFDACPLVGEGCHTEFYTRKYYPCCDPPINP
jgi:hypothetical protein